MTLRGKKCEYRTAGNHILDHRQTQVFIDDWKRRVRILKWF